MKNPKRFHIKADAFFYADGIEGAFHRLAHHFSMLAAGYDGEDTSIFVPPSNISVKVIPESSKVVKP